MGTILLENMRFHAFHGVLPEEQVIGTTYSVTVRLTFDFRKAAKTDSLSDTINYAEIYSLVKKEIEQKSCLIENVAQRILQRILLRYPQIKVLEVSLSKHHPPVGGEMEMATVVLTYPDNNL